MTQSEVATAPAVRRLPTVGAVHERLRQDILRGRLAPGTVLSQVQLATQYGVSRTPLREAMRMLQEEGLLQAESNRRTRVATFRLDDLEAISGQRILASALATLLTVGRMSAQNLADLERAFNSACQMTEQNDADGWRKANLVFHDLHTARAPSLLLQDMRRLQERNNLYRSVWLRDDPHLDLKSVAEHRAILEACQAGDATAAAHAIARHNARIAITVMASAVPERDPITIRTALQLALGAGTGPHS